MNSQHIKVLSIGSDTKLFHEGSAVRNRAIEYGKLFEELHIVVFSLKRSNFSKQQVAGNVWIYPTSSISKLLFVNDALFECGRLIKEKRFEQDRAVITVQDPFESGLVGAALKFWLHMPLHVQVHTDFFDSHFASQLKLNRIRKMLASFVIRRADSVRAVSQKLKEKISSAYSIASEKIAVLPIFVDVRHIAEAASPQNFKEKYPGFDSVGLIASRLTKEKRIDLALEAIALVVNENPLIGLVITGEGPEAPRLHELVKTLGLEQNVFFEGWQQDPISFFKASDFFVLTSSYEGYGMTLIEAAAAKLPIVSSNVGIAPDLISDGINSFLCARDTRECFAEKILLLGSDANLRQAFGERIFTKANELAGSKEEYLDNYKKSIESARMRQ